MVSRWRWIVASVVVGPVVTLVLAEVALRLLPIAAVDLHRRGAARAESAVLFSYDPALGWRGRAGVHGTQTGWESASEVRLNGRGFRDVEVPLGKPPGVLRIVVLGDSISWGQGVGQTERYADILARAVSRPGVAVDVVNLAVSGYGTDQELLLWEHEGRHYCADLVLLGLYENDLRENTLAFQGRYPKPYFRRSSDGTLTLHNVPVPRVPDAPPPAPPRGLRAWLQRELRVWAALAALRQALRAPELSAEKPPDVSPESVDLTAALVSRLAASVRRDGSALAVVVLPDLHDSAATREAAARSGVATLDLAPVFRRAAGDGRPLFYRLDGAHWTAAGHALAAEAIARWIVATSRLPAVPRVCGD